MFRLLFIDDDESLLQVNERYFSRAGYEVQVATSATGYQEILDAFKPDCIILDVMMPNVNGFQLGRLIRSTSDVPIIYLTGRSDDESLITGLGLGANDYVKKPYSYKELEARIKVQLRVNVSAPVNKGMLSYPPLKVDYVNHQVFHLDEEIHLSNREYELLYLLVSRPNETVTYQDVGMKLWGYYSESDRQTIMVTTSRLRKKLESYPKLANRIESVWSKGYKFSAKGDLT